jgi:predicted HD phosphohydrolase
MAAHDKILVLETFDQRIHRRLSDIDQRSAGSLAHDLGRIAKQFNHDWHRSRITDFAQRFRGGTFDGTVTITTGHD